MRNNATCIVPSRLRHTNAIPYAIITYCSRHYSRIVTTYSYHVLRMRRPCGSGKYAQLMREVSVADPQIVINLFVNPSLADRKHACHSGMGTQRSVTTRVGYDTKSSRSVHESRPPNLSCQNIEHFENSATNSSLVPHWPSSSRMFRERFPLWQERGTKQCANHARTKIVQVSEGH